MSYSSPGSLALALTFLALLRGGVPAQASNLTLAGSFHQDDQVQLFSLVTAGAQPVDIRSYGYAGGTTPTGVVVPRGGLDTILSLFDASGTLLTQNDDGSGVAVNPLTGSASDARISLSLAAGGYTVALTQYDNFALGPDLSNGFVENGHPNFTADPSFTSGGPCAGNLFRDISGTPAHCRTGNWVLAFSNITSVTEQSPVPEPSTLGSLFLALAAFSFLAGKRFANRVVRLSRGGFLLLLIALHMQAQVQNSAPDYSHVPDFLGGERTLLADDDIVITAYNPKTSPGSLHSYTGATAVVDSANGVSTTSKVNQTNVDMTDNRIFQAFAGRLYQSDHDQYLTVVPTPDAPYLNMTDGSKTTSLASFPSVRAGSSYTTFSAVMADFNGDGFADLAVNFGPGDENGDMVIFSGAGADGSFSPHYGPVHGIDGNSEQETLLAMTAGDFDGDGRNEIAGLAYKRTGRYVICIYKVDPATLAIKKVSEITPDYSAEGNFSAVQYYSLTAGTLTAGSNRQLVYAYSTGVGKDVKLSVFDFSAANGSLVGKELVIKDVASAPNAPEDVVQVQAARFDSTSAYDQIAFLFAWQNNSRSYGSGTKYIRTFTFNQQDNTLTPNATTDFSTAHCVSNMTIGNFDKKTTVNGIVQPDLTLQISFITSDCTPGNPATLFILGVAADGKTYTPDQENFTIPSAITKLGGVFVAAGDMQGRSLVLGEPTKITIPSTIQPSEIIASPPMHVDFIQDADNRTCPPPNDHSENLHTCVLNLSANFEGFYSTFEFANTSDRQSDSTNGTTWSFGAVEKRSDSVAFGNAEEGKAGTIKNSFTAAQNLNHAHSHDHGTYSKTAFNAYTKTGFGDQVFYTDTSYNIYVYPVLGQRVCPLETPKCTDPQNLTIQFAAPNGNRENTSDQAQALQWYQPVWEPGNVLSYPANYPQLKEIVPDIDLLSNDSNSISFLTDQSTGFQKVEWSTGSKEADSTSFVQNYSFEDKISASVTAGIPGIFTYKGKMSLDLSGSFGFNSLNESTTTLGTSSGIAINKPGTFPVFQDYGYRVHPYIFGQTKPGGSVDNKPLSGDVQTFRLLQTAFTADPTAGGAGGWWTQRYTVPDIAFNHPSRWNITFRGLSNPIPPECLATGTGASQMDCAEFNVPQPDDLWLDLFSQMRGFFITSAASPGQGPQLATANAGDVLTLQARVYNYSFAAMPSDSHVHVRFYFQPWKDNVPLTGKDGNPLPSVLIQEVTLAPIPPFNNGGSQLNSVLASATFDTGKYEQTKNGGANVAFWVVAWGETGDGQLLSEMPSHGLAAIPGDLASLRDVQIQPYSNNVGFYRVAFPILAKNSLGASQPSNTGSINIGKVQLSTLTTTPGEGTIVSSELRTYDTPLAGVSVSFFDGDPRRGGQSFATDHIAYVGAESTYQVSAVFKSKACGARELFLVVNRGKLNQIIRRAPLLQVSCTRGGIRFVSATEP